MEEIVKIVLKGDKMLSLKINTFDDIIDVEDIEKISSHNILGEILTFPVIMNRIGNLQAEMDEILAEAELELQIKQAELGGYYRRNLIKKVIDDKKIEKTVYPTVAEVEAAVTLDAVYQNCKKKIIRLNKEKQMINSFFWAAKSKDDKLNKLSEKLRPDEFERELLEETINGITIKMYEKLIK
jgi:hypothetical protein